MTEKMDRRSFLKLLPAVPFLGLRTSSAVKALGRAATDKPNILFLLFDSLSARNISLYGYRRETMPNLARFAQRATVYHNHYAAGNFTSPATASLFTGTYPWSHRAFHLYSRMVETFADRNLFRLFDTYHTVTYTHNMLVSILLDQFRHDLDHWKRTRELALLDPKLSERLFPDNFHLAYLSERELRGGLSSGSLFISMLDKLFRVAGERRLWDIYREQFPRGIPKLHMIHFVLEDVTDWLMQALRDLPAPYFLYLHALPPHDPYYTRSDFIDRFADGWKPTVKDENFMTEGHTQEFLNEQRRYYDEYVAYVDAEFGRLYDFMLEQRILDDTCVVVTSDHGELFERGIRGHITPALYEPIVHIPLLISFPGQERREDVYAQTSAVDVMPTLLDMAGQPVPEWCEGVLLPVRGGTPTGGQRSIYVVEAKQNPKLAPLSKATMAMIKGRHKLIRYMGHEKQDVDYELYDLANDPEELENRYERDGDTAAQLRQELEAKLDEVNGRTQALGAVGRI